MDDQINRSNLNKNKKEGELNMNITISGKMEEITGHSEKEEEANIKERFVNRKR